MYKEKKNKKRRYKKDIFINVSAEVIYAVDKTKNQKKSKKTKKKPKKNKIYILHLEFQFHSQMLLSFLMKTSH